MIAPASAVALGGLAILVSLGGVSNRLPLVVLTIALGIAAALAPPRIGLPLAVGLACFEGFLHDFAGPRALYWNEAFTVLVVARSLLAKRATRLEAVAAAGVAIVFGAYLVTGTGLKADAWGLKVLLTSAVVAWALARVNAVTADVWRRLYFALVVVAGGSVILGAWQRAKGVDGLQGLGLVYGQRIREIAGGGTVRVFAGFTSAAPFSYMLAIALSAWAAFALGTERERRDALATAWLPLAAAAGIVLTVDRTAVIALVAAFAVLASTHRRRLLLPAVAAAGLFVLAIVVTRGPDTASGGFASTLQARAALWGQYLEDVRPFGRGPASAGSAYDKVEPPGWTIPIRVPASWDVDYDRIVLSRQSLAVLATRLPRRPPLVVTGRIRSLAPQRRLTVTSGYILTERSPKLFDDVIPRRAEPISIRVPADREREAALWLTARRGRPPGPPPPVRPKYVGTLANLVYNPSFEAGRRTWKGSDGPFEDPVQVRVVKRGGAVGRAALRVGRAQAGAAGDQGAYYEPLALREGTEYAISLWMRGEDGGEAVYLTVQHTFRPVAASTNSDVIRLTREWRRYEFVFTSPTTNPIALLLVRSAGLPTGGAVSGPQTYFLDGVQVERGGSVSPYCDGDQPHCRWASIRGVSRSFRAGRTRLTAPLADGRGSALVRVSSTADPMPQKVPFSISIDGEDLEVTSIVDDGTYRATRAVDKTTPSAHVPGAAVWANFATGIPPKRRSDAVRPLPFDVAATPAFELRGLRVSGLPAPRTHAERIWQKWLDETPAALEGDGPGLVDNLYVAWLWQYGVLGLLLCGAWIAILLRPAFVREKDAAAITATLVGTFLVVAALAVSVWEESPTDLLAAFVFAWAFGSRVSPGEAALVTSRGDEGLRSTRRPRGRRARRSEPREREDGSDDASADHVPEGHPQPGHGWEADDWDG